MKKNSQVGVEEPITIFIPPMLILQILNPAQKSSKET